MPENHESRDAAEHRGSRTTRSLFVRQREEI